MYGKVFTSMYDGTLATKGPWQALVTFQQLIVLSDKDGVVDMTADAIARRTSIPIDIIASGITALMEADPESRTPDEEGRRITLLEDHRTWGWQIVNYAKYAAIRTAEERREYLRIAKAASRARRKLSTKESTPVNNVNTLSVNVNRSTDVSVPVDVSVDIDGRKNTRATRSPSRALSVSDLVADGVNEEHALDWIKARGKVPLTRTAWNAVKAEAVKAGIVAGQAVKIAAENGWRGFKADWSPKKQSTEQRDAEAMRLLGIGDVVDV